MHILLERIKAIDELVERMKKGKEVPLVEILREEIEKLKRLNEQYEDSLRRKSIKTKEEEESKIKYTLSDGSVYVVHKLKKYKYLYDAGNSCITYEFPNGQIERTFPGGIKEIRAADGRIIIKHADKDYDVL
ncbi:hypothetical protein NEFER03_0431 [Nematocida sp. LUAm3]|nr:hypothetical protein NEFER03_0431 [Nematocida sp. LUAm3]